MKRLKPCPFCGREFFIEAQKYDVSYFILCTNCFAKGPLEDTIIKARNKWNKRKINKDE